MCNTYATFYQNESGEKLFILIKKRTCVTCSVLNWSTYLIKRLFKIEIQPTRSGHNHFIFFSSKPFAERKAFLCEPFLTIRKSYIKETVRYVKEAYCSDKKYCSVQEMNRFVQNSYRVKLICATGLVASFRINVKWH